MLELSSVFIQLWPTFFKSYLLFRCDTSAKTRTILLVGNETSLTLRQIHFFIYKEDRKIT